MDDTGPSRLVEKGNVDSYRLCVTTCEVGRGKGSDSDGDGDEGQDPDEGEKAQGALTEGGADASAKARPVVAEVR